MTFPKTHLDLRSLGVRHQNILKKKQVDAFVRVPVPVPVNKLMNDAIITPPNCQTYRFVIETQT